MTPGGSVAVLSPPVGQASPVLAPQLVLDLGAGRALVGLPLPHARFQLARVDARSAFGVTLRSAAFGWHWDRTRSSARRRDPSSPLG
ncbi:MAG: hypothetical protein ACRDPU_15070, partial [Thermoleophilia bacterium]